MNFKELIYEQLKAGLIKSGNRSKRRTDRLHESIVSIIQETIPDFNDNYKVDYEEPIDCAYGNKFNIDIHITDKRTNQLHTCILVKAMISSVQKNRANYANTTIGESVRVKKVEGRDGVNVWFVTLIPNMIPSYKSDGSLVRMESKETAYINPAPLLSDDSIFCSTITYDVNSVDYSSKDNYLETLELASIDNVDSTEFYNVTYTIF